MTAGPAIVLGILIGLVAGSRNRDVQPVYKATPVLDERMMSTDHVCIVFEALRVAQPTYRPFWETRENREEYIEAET